MVGSYSEMMAAVAAAQQPSTAGSTSSARNITSLSNIQAAIAAGSEDLAPASGMGHMPRSVRERELREAVGAQAGVIVGTQGNDAGLSLLRQEDINDKAVSVMQRITHKLTGRDFNPLQPLHVAEQVDRLIEQARSPSNLSALYVGWCPFW